MSIQNLLRDMENQLRSSGSIPFSSKRSVDVDTCLEILDQIRASLPEELDQSELIIREKQQILEDAEMEANAILQDANAKAEQLTQEHVITEKAKEVAREIVLEAQANAREVRISARGYVDRILTDVSKDMQRWQDEIDRNRQELHRGGSGNG